MYNESHYVILSTTQKIYTKCACDIGTELLLVYKLLHSSVERGQNLDNYQPSDLIGLQP